MSSPVSPSVPPSSELEMRLSGEDDMLWSLNPLGLEGVWAVLMWVQLLLFVVCIVGTAWFVWTRGRTTEPKPSAGRGQWAEVVLAIFLFGGSLAGLVWYVSAMSVQVTSSEVLQDAESHSDQTDMDKSREAPTVVDP